MVKNAVDNNIEKCLILEDDTVFYDNFNEEFEKILKLPQQYDLLYLNRNALYSIYGLGKEHNESLVVIGDYSQALYSFRGSEPKTMFDFAKKYPEAKKYLLENPLENKIIDKKIIRKV
jgi:superfamily I DNA/RNA helicase